MKYGESTFDIFYLVTTILVGLWILKNHHDRKEKMMGLAVLILGCGDAFHLVPRVLNYFVNTDFTAALGLGKLVTSITMTVFYVLMYHICIEHYSDDSLNTLRTPVYLLTVLRIVLCLFPQNGWFENRSDMTWGILRNIPFVVLGALIVWMYRKHRKDDRSFRFIWLYVLLSFAFYLPVAVFAGVRPILGMLMLPKTVCYMLIVYTFYRFVKR